MMSRCICAWVLTVGILSSLSVTGVYAVEPEQQNVPPTPKFEINEFKIDGNSLLPEQDIAALLEPHIGKSRDFGDVQRALEALEKAYRNKGYGAVQVFLPEQELNRGIVTLRVIERKIGSFNIEGNQFYSIENVQATLPSVQMGASPVMKEIRRSLQVANTNPTKQTSILFRNNDTDDELVDVTAKVVDEKPWKAYLTLDNTGSRETLHGRISLGYQHFNVLGKDHRVTAQYITNNHSPKNFFNPEHKVNIFGLSYFIPFYEWGGSLNLVAGYSDVETGPSATLIPISVTGKGLVLGAHYNYNFDRVGANYDHKLIGGIDYRAYRNNVLSNGDPIGLSPYVSTTPWSLAYEGIWQTEKQRLSFNLAGNWNVYPSLVSHGNPSFFSVFPYLAESHYAKYNFNVDYTYLFKNTWRIHAAVSGQLTKDHLIPGERFRAGGMDSVRGWHESAISADEGYRYSIELISQDFGYLINDQTALRGLIFNDNARLKNNRGVFGSRADPAADQFIASIGFGVRYNYLQNVVARFDYGYVVDGDISNNNPSGSRRPGDMFSHFRLGIIW